MNCAPTEIFLLDGHFFPHEIFYTQREYHPACRNFNPNVEYGNRTKTNREKNQNKNILITKTVKNHQQQKENSKVSKAILFWKIFFSNSQGKEKMKSKHRYVYISIHLYLCFPKQQNTTMRRIIKMHLKTRTQLNYLATNWSR